MSSEPVPAPAMDAQQSATEGGEQPEGQQTGGIVKLDVEKDDVFEQLGPKGWTPNPPPLNRSYEHCIPPDPITQKPFSVFLAGSIQMGEAIQWQRRMAQNLQDLPISVYNPRRGNWDTSGTQEAKDKAFEDQVAWEHEGLAQASVICFFFDHTTTSPITKMELGKWLASGKVVVCCNKRFYRSGNIHFECKETGTPMVQNFLELEALIRAMLRQKGLMVDKEGEITQNVDDADWSKLPGEDVLQKAGQDPEKLERLRLMTLGDWYTKWVAKKADAGPQEGK